jgi:hypothetical protein
LTQLFKKRQTLRGGSWTLAMDSTTLMKDCTITLPEHFMCRENNVDSLIDTIYPGITAPHHNLDSYFSKCTILSGLNSDLDSLNEAILQRFPRDIHTFHSAGFIPNSEHTGDVNINTDGPVQLILNLERKWGSRTQPLTSSPA